MSDIKLIYKKLPAIMAEVGAIEKNKRASAGGGGSYNFRGIDDIYFALQPLLAKHGVTIVPKVLSSSREERETKSGGSITYTVLTVQYTFYAEDGSSIEAVTVGEAMDTSDKSSNKAMSAAMKYLALQTFCIPTEEEKDTEYQHHEPNYRNPKPSPEREPAKVLTVVPGGDPGAYVIKCGKKYIGQRLDAIGPHAADAYGKYLKDSALQTGKPLTGDFLEAANAIDAFCKSRETKKGSADIF